MIQNRVRKQQYCSLQQGSPPLSDIGKEKYEKTKIFKARAAAPNVERGRQQNGGVPGALLKKRHCLMGKYAFESAKVDFYFVLIKLS